MFAMLRMLCVCMCLCIDRNIFVCIGLIAINQWSISAILIGTSDAINKAIDGGKYIPSGTGTHLDVDMHAYHLLHEQHQNRFTGTAVHKH